MSKGVLLLISVLVVGLVGYIGAYQYVINERVKLEDEHCMKVNPLIIKRKNLYLDSMRALQDQTGKYEELNDKYIEVTKKYIAEEDKWLQKDLVVLANPVVRMVVNKNGYQGVLLLHRIYELDLLDSKIILKLLHEEDPKEQEKLSKEISKNVAELKKAESSYQKISHIRNYRFVDYLIRIPPTKCPVENYQIPDVEKELEKIFLPGSQMKEGTPS